ncbi:unnamed protein product, partial [Iphiclides podalirius]
MIVDSCVLGRWQEFWQNCFGSSLRRLLWRQRILTECCAKWTAPVRRTRHGPEPLLHCALPYVFPGYSPNDNVRA